MHVHQGFRRFFSAAFGIVSTSAAITSGGFQINAVKTDQGGTDIIELFFFNDGLNGTGSRLEAYQVSYKGPALKFSTGPDDEGGTVVDVYNHDNNSTRSWLRVHPKMNDPFQTAPGLGDPRWGTGISSFGVTYITLALDPIVANVAKGAQFARLVVPDGADFRFTGKVGGEIGPSAPATFDYGYFIANLPPVIAQPPAAFVALAEDGGIEVDALASLSATQVRRVRAYDPDGELLSFTVSDQNDAVSKGFTLTKVGADAFDIAWTPADTVPGTYAFSFMARDSSVQANSTSTALMQINVVPEPTTLGLAVIALAARRARRND